MGDRDPRGGMGGLKAYYLQERPMLERLLAARLGGAAAEAQDVLPDVWLRLVRVTGSPIAQPGGFLFRMANTIATDRLRAAAARAQRERHWADARGNARAPSIDAALIAAEHRYDQVRRRGVAETLGVSVDSRRGAGRATRSLAALAGVRAIQAGSGWRLVPDGPGAG